MDRRNLYRPRVAVVGSAEIASHRRVSKLWSWREPYFLRSTIMHVTASLLITGAGLIPNPLQTLAISIAAGVDASPYSQWSNGPPTTADFFPIAVFNQTPDHIAEFKAIGINTFVGFWGDLNPVSLAAYAAAGVTLMPGQNSVALSLPQRASITGWTQLDEPDNAQPDGIFGYGPCLTPNQIIAAYKRIRGKDATRPVFLNFGRGVSDTTWRGRGRCSGQTESYYPYAVAGGDLISFDIYPVANYNGRLELVPNGIDNLKRWVAASGSNKIIWNFVEGVPIGSGTTPTAAQIKAEVWMSLTHGSQGIIYFVHQFSPSGGLIRADGIFNFPSLVEAVAAINDQVTALAPVLNSPSIADGVNVASPATTPISTMVKQYNGATHVFAVAMRSNPGTAHFTLPNISSGTAQVLGENRQLAIFGGSFQDVFSGYAVHLYEITGK
jgi:hypothetical protein